MSRNVMNDFDESWDDTVVKVVPIKTTKLKKPKSESEYNKRKNKHNKRKNKYNKHN